MKQTGNGGSVMNDSQEDAPSICWFCARTPLDCIWMATDGERQVAGAVIDWRWVVYKKTRRTKERSILIGRVRSCPHFMLTYRGEGA